MRDTNGWPTYSTWLLACWLGARKYAYLGEVVLAHWRRFRSKPRGSERSRAVGATKIERDVRGVTSAVVLFDNTTGQTMPATEAILADVDWIALADNSLKRFEDYQPA